MNQLTTIFLGPQGCGKGTQLALLKDYIATQDPGRPIVHFEMGKNLRELAARGGYTGEKTSAILARGELMPYAVSCSVFVQYLINAMHGDEHLLIDGFPRTADQLSALDSAFEFFVRSTPVVLFIDISDDEALKRLAARGREDDTQEGIRKRLAWSREETMPNVEWFRTNPKYTVLQINGEQSIEQTHREVLSKLGLLKQ